MLKCFLRAGVELSSRPKGRRRRSGLRPERSPFTPRQLARRRTAQVRRAASALCRVARAGPRRPAAAQHVVCKGLHALLAARRVPGDASEHPCCGGVARRAAPRGSFRIPCRRRARCTCMPSMRRARVSRDICRWESPRKMPLSTRVAAARAAPRRAAPPMLHGAAAPWAPASRLNRACAWRAGEVAAGRASRPTTRTAVVAQLRPSPASGIGRANPAHAVAPGGACPVPWPWPRCGPLFLYRKTLVPIGYWIDSCVLSKKTPSPRSLTLQRRPVRAWPVWGRGRGVCGRAATPRAGLGAALVRVSPALLRASIERALAHLSGRAGIH